MAPLRQPTGQATRQTQGALLLDSRLGITPQALLHAQRIRLQGALPALRYRRRLQLIQGKVRHTRLILEEELLPPIHQAGRKQGHLFQRQEAAGQRALPIRGPKVVRGQRSAQVGVSLPVAVQQAVSVVEAVLQAVVPALLVADARDK